MLCFCSFKKKVETCRHDGASEADVSYRYVQHQRLSVRHFHVPPPRGDAHEHEGVSRQRNCEGQPSDEYAGHVGLVEHQTVGFLEVLLFVLLTVYYCNHLKNW